MATEYRQRPGMGDHFDDEDLVMSSAQQRRNWRGILIALMVIVAVLAMIVTSVVLLTPPQPEELSDSYSDSATGDGDGSDYYYNQRAHDELWWRRRGMRALRLSDLLTDSASIKTFNGTWISGNEAFYVTDAGGLAVMEVGADAAIRTTRHLMSKQTLRELKGPLISFELSPDRNHVLIGHDAKKLHRYSKTARYTVYTVLTEQLTPVLLDENSSADRQPYLLHAQWHEISTAADKNADRMALIAVYRYDVFYVPWTTPVDEDTVTGNVTGSVTASPKTSGAAVVGKGDANSTTSGRPATHWPHGPARRITTSGSGTPSSVAGTFSNGVADYLYETEILKRSPAVWPSSGRYLMYATFDGRRVGEYKYAIYTKDGKTEDGGGLEDRPRRRQRLRKKKRRRRRNEKSEEPTVAGAADETPEYYLYPEVRAIKYPKANTPNPIVTLSVIVNLDQLGNPKVQPKIRTLTPPPIFQYTDDYYFTAAQWVNDGGVGGVGGSLEDDDVDKSSASAAEICVVWLNRAQNTSVTTLCKSPMWMCQETQVIHAVGGGGNGKSDVGGQTSVPFAGDRARRRYRRATAGRRQRNGAHQHGRRRRAGGNVGGGREKTSTAGRYGGGGWVDASVGGAGGGVPSTGGVDAMSASVWWSADDDADSCNFAGDDGYAAAAGAGIGHVAAVLVRRGWETGDKELTPRVPVFAADGQGYVSVAPVRDDADDGGRRDNGGGEGGVRLRRPSPPSSSSQKQRDRPSVGEYFAQLVAVNITKKLLAPLTFGEPDGENGGGGSEDREKKTFKSWTVIRILAWDQRTDMIYFLAVPSGRGAPHHRHLYAVKFTSPSYSSTASDSRSRSGYHHQQQPQYQKTVRNRPVCLSCDVGLTVNTRSRKRRDLGGKQNRMDEARDDRLRQQQRERWEKQKEVEEANNQEKIATAEGIEMESRQQQNRRRQQKDVQNRGATRHCTYYDAQFSRDGSHYALVCLGPSVPYVTLHRIATDYGRAEDQVKNDDDDGGSVDREANVMQDEAQKSLKRDNNSTYSFEFIALVENNTRLQDKYTNRVLLPGTRTFQLRLSGGRKLTTSGGLHFNDPLAAADYYSNGGDGGAGQQQTHFSSRKRSDSDPLTVAQVRLYLPLSVYDPEADQRPEFMQSNRVGYPDDNKADVTTVPGVHNRSVSFTRDRRRRRRSPASRDGKDDGGPKRPQRRPYKRRRGRRYKKLYPMLVVVNSDPGSQAITDRFADRLGYATALLCSGSLSKTPVGVAGGTVPGANGRDRRGENKGRRDRRSAPATRYYSSDRSYDEHEGSHDRHRRERYDDEAANNEYVVAVIDPGRGTWARGYESLLALNSYDGHGLDGDESDGEYGGPLGTADIRDRMEAVEYLLSSATTAAADADSRDGGQGYYSDDRGKAGGRGSRDRSGWFSSSSQSSSRRYFSDNDDDDNDDEYYYNSYDEYDDNNNNDYEDEDYYYYYYSDGGDNSDYGGGGHREDDDVRRVGSEKRSRKDRRSVTSDTRANSAEALRLPYVDATRVALLGGGPTSASASSSIYGGYAAARMALWQSVYGGAPLERRTGEEGKNENRKEPVAIHSSFRCAISMAPVYSWRLYASAFSERYYGYHGGKDEDNNGYWTSYDRSNLIPFAESSNDTWFRQTSNGKGINLLVMHGTADTSVHPQHSMMLVREVMQRQQQQPAYAMVPNGGGNAARRGNDSRTESPGRRAGGHAFRTGAIRISQLVLPDVDLSNSRTVAGAEHDRSPFDRQHRLLHSVYGHVTQYLAAECFTGVRDGTRGRGVRVRGRSLRKRGRRWRAGNRSRGEEDADDDSDVQQQRRRAGEHRPQQHQKVRRSVRDNPDGRLGGVADSGRNVFGNEVESERPVAGFGVRTYVNETTSVEKRRSGNASADDGKKPERNEYSEDADEIEDDDQQNGGSADCENGGKNDKKDYGDWNDRGDDDDDE